MSEFYLAMLNRSETEINNYNKNGKLKVLCIYTIRGLHRNRKRTKKNKHGYTSTLNELNDKLSFDMLDNFVLDDVEPIKEIELKEQVEEQTLEIVKNIVFDSMNRFYTAKDPKSISTNDFDMAVFVCSQNESINSISKRTNINRVSLTKSKQRAELKLRKIITNDNRNRTQTY